MAAQLEEWAAVDSVLHRSSPSAEELLAESAAEAPKKKMMNHCYWIPEEVPSELWADEGWSVAPSMPGGEERLDWSEDAT